MVESLESADFAIERGLSKFSADLTLNTLDGATFQPKVTADLSKEPMVLSLELGSFLLPVADITSFLPPSIQIPDSIEEIDLTNVAASGPMGKWNDWRIEASTSFKLESLYLETSDVRLDGLDAVVKLVKQGATWEGSGRLDVREAYLPTLPVPARGLTAGQLTFSLGARGGLRASTDWTAQDILGSVFRGSFELGSGGSISLEARSAQFQPQKLGLALAGDWEVAAKLNRTSPTPGGFKLQLDASTQRFTLPGNSVPPAPLSARLVGEIALGESPRWSSAQLMWGKLARLEMTGINWSPPRFSAGRAVLSGDLTALTTLAPELGSNPLVGRWVDPRKWSIDGPVSLVVSPEISLRVDKAQLDSGRGLTGPITFTYSGGDRTWTFVSPTIRLNLRSFIRDSGFGDYPIEGSLLAVADLRGVIPSPGDTNSKWLRTGVINGKIENSNGDIGPPEGRSDPWMGWRGLAGEFEGTWNAEASKLSLNLYARDWIFHTPAGMARRAEDRQLATPARLECLIVKETDLVYEVRYMRALLGENSPIQLDVKGTVTRGRSAWIPELKVRGQADRARPTPIFRGTRIGGSGSLLGEIQGTAAGSWDFNGNLVCDGLLFEKVTTPIILKDVRDTLSIRDVKLDELMSREKWRRSGFKIPSSPDKTGSLNRAFSQSSKTPITLRIGEARIGRTDYRDLKVRGIVQGEILFLNTVEGSFAQGGYPFQATGFTFAVPGAGAGLRLRGRTERIPLNLGVPGFEDRFKLTDEALEVDFYISRTPPHDRVETRFIKLGFPLSQLKSIPGFGNLILGWAPDSLGTDMIVLQRVGDGDWNAINPFKLPDAGEIPDYLRNLPAGFFKGVGEGIRDVFR